MTTDNDRSNTHSGESNNIVWDDSGKEIYQQHGISKLKIEGKIATGKDDNGRLLTKDQQIIDGSRLILFREDNSVSTWRGAPKILPVYDDVWNLRDVIYSQTQAQFEGDPIAMSVTNPETFDLSPDAEEDIEDEIEEFITSGRQIFSPVQGLTIERIGGPSLEDPEDIIWTLSSRIAQVSELPTKMLMSSPAASDQTEDSDILTYAGDIMVRRDEFALPILQHLGILGKWIRSIPSTTTFPMTVDWPDIRLHSPRERGYLWGQAARTLAPAEETGRGLPREIERMFPEGEGAPRNDDGLSARPTNNRDIRRLLHEIIDRLDQEGL